MRTAGIICATLLACGGCTKAEAPHACVPVLQGWSSEQTGKPVATIENRVTLSGHQILWNGYPLDEKTLDRYLRTVAVMNPIPFMVFDPGPTPDCAFARHIRDMIDRQLPCREGGCWQGSKQAYERAPYKKPTGSGVP